MNEAKVIPIMEDAVQCYFYSIKSSTDEQYWNTLEINIQETIQTLSNDYIWHKEKFRVYKPISLPSSTSGHPPHLHSITQFGDNLEDEWFITYLVSEITKLHEDVIVQINDSDGEFLLIEAARVLPDWANPRSTENRVFIHLGNIHLIPPSIIPTNKKVDIKDALNVIKRKTLAMETRASLEIQLAILERIVDYPMKLVDNFHRAILELPLSLATILDMKPSLVAAITNAYCERDSIEARQCKNINSTEEKMHTTVTFTKCLYAMLKHSKPLNNFRNLNRNADLSQKLTAGYHIMINKCSDIFASKQWNLFLTSLTNNGYFKGNLVGSKDYVQLLNTAKEYYTKNECSLSINIANEVKDLINSDEYKHKYEQITKRDILLIDDSDCWLDINQSQLDNLLKSRYGKEAEFASKGLTPHSLSTHLKTFLTASSDFEGIENNASDDNEINFNADVFGDCLKDILDKILPEEEVDDLDELSCDDEEMGTDSDDVCETELKQSLKGFDNSNSKDTMTNLAQSIKEEGSHSGPSSILLKQVGINKTDLLDSDDEED